MQYLNVAGDFFAVGVELFASDVGADVGGVEGVLDVFQALHDFAVALFHRQLEVDDGLPAPAAGQPAGQQRAAACGLIDDVADHPLYRTGRFEQITVGLDVLDLAAVHQAAGHGAVIHGGDFHVPVDQLPGPAAGCGTQVHSGHARGQAAVPFIPGDEVVPGFFQLEGRAAGRLPGEFQPGYAHRPGCGVVRPGPADKQPLTAFEEHMQARCLGVLRTYEAGLGQGGVQWPLELLGQCGQRFAVVGVGGFQPQLGGNRASGAGADDR